MAKYNLGAGGQNYEGFINLDLFAPCEPDVVGKLPDLPFVSESAEEIVASHILEHLTHVDAIATLAECFRVLKPDGSVIVAVPDTREIMRGYIEKVNRPGPGLVPGAAEADHTDLDVLNHLYLHSTVQQSHHLWNYDEDTLIRIVAKAGFEWAAPHPRRQWWEVAVRAVKEPSVQPDLPYQRLLLKSRYAPDNKVPVAVGAPEGEGTRGGRNGDATGMDRKSARKWLLGR